MYAQSSAKPQLRYIDYFLQQTFATLFINLKIFPSSSDISESVGAFLNAIRYFPDLRSEGGKQDVILVIGDGETPRTSAVFHEKTQGYKVIGVDPLLRKDKKYEIFERLIIVPKKVEEVEIFARKIFIILMHAHVSLEAVLSSIKTGDLAGVLACPCCEFYPLQALIFGRSWSFQKFDFAILAKENRIRVWKFSPYLEVRSSATSDVNHNMSLIDDTSISTLMQGYKPLKTETIHGIIANRRKFNKNFIFFDVWETSVDYSSFEILSKLAKEHSLPKPHERDSRQQTSCIHACFSKKIFQYGNIPFEEIFQNGNLVSLRGYITFSRKGYLVFMTETCILNQSFERLSRIKIELC